MGTLKLEQPVARPPDEVFGYLLDHTNLAVWQQDVRIERLDEDRPWDVIGTRFRKTRKTPMGKTSLTLEQTMVDRPARTFEYRVLDGMARGSRERWTVEPHGTGSLVRMDAPTTWNGAARLFAPLLDRFARRQVGGELVRLRDLLERRG